MHHAEQDGSARRHWHMTLDTTCGQRRRAGPGGGGGGGGGGLPGSILIFAAVICSICAVYCMDFTKINRDVLARGQ